MKGASHIRGDTTHFRPGVTILSNASASAAITYPLVQWFSTCGSQSILQWATEHFGLNGELTFLGGDHPLDHLFSAGKTV